MSKKKSLLFYCQHSVGIGHLIRTLALIDELRLKFDISVISGGQFPERIPIPKNINFVQLPAVGLDDNGNLEVVHHLESVHNVMKKRRQLVIETFNRILPDIIITEYFPFGKIQFLGELLPLLKKAKKKNPHTLIISSIRDILEPTSMAKNLIRDTCLSLIQMYYDAILVHSDPDVIKLDETFGSIRAIEDLIHYTGFVTRQQRRVEVDHRRSNKVVLSMGGGKIGPFMANRVVDSFLDHGFGPGISLQIVTGPMYPDSEFDRLHQKIGDRYDIELIKSVPSLIDKWRTARLSISFCGYNTLMEIVHHRIPALVLPFYNDQNFEQPIRAELFERVGAIRSLDLDQVTNRALADHVVACLDFQPGHTGIKLDGARRSGIAIKKIFAQKEAKRNTVQPINHQMRKGIMRRREPQFLRDTEEQPNKRFYV